MVVLFACVHNAGRSQMAAAFFNRFVDSGLASAVSAGTSPAERPHPEVIFVMQEEGIDLSQAKPRLLTDELARTVNLLITMGCGDKCPMIPGLKILEWNFADPKGQDLNVIRKIRDEIKLEVLKLIEQLALK